MKRGQLEELLRTLGRVAGRTEIVVVGSQCVHAATDRVPAEVLMSVECDVLVDEQDPARPAIDAALGPASELAAEHGVHVDVVSPGFPFLPDGWEQRLRALDAGGVTARCLEIHDLVLSKLAAGRLKDYELVAALFGQRLADPEVARARISTVGDLTLRAVLLARVQIVLESMGRG